MGAAFARIGTKQCPRKWARRPGYAFRPRLRLRPEQAPSIVGNPGRVIETSFAITERVNCDRTRIGQLVSNLIGNALSHGARDKPVQVGAKTEGGVFELRVANAGDPIPPSAMDKLFEPFFRGDVRDSRQALGLGLHIASQIAQAHGGRIAVTSTPDETSFVFSMPMPGR